MEKEKSKWLVYDECYLVIP